MFRIIDANLNRLREGLRVIEDILRFHFSSEKFEEIKNIRHSLKKISRFYEEKNLLSRNSATDLGRKSFDVEKDRKSIKDVLAANFKRAQESLRTLEETLKLSDNPDFSSLMKEIRYKVYVLEKDIFFLFKTTIKLSLYLVTDSRQCQIPLFEHVELAIKGGVSFVQLREKHLSDKKIFEIGKQTKNICNKYNVPFVIDDRVDLCIALGADGVHIGQNDLSVKTVRSMLGPSKIIGKSTHTLEQVKEAVREDIDYFAFGPLYKTPRKNYVPVGFDFIKTVLEISKQTNIPVVFIGGISKETIDDVLKIGIKNIALVRDIMSSPNPKESSEFLINKIKGKTL